MMKRIIFLLLALLVAIQGGEVFARQLRINGHRFVDLQLPSGLLWAETNIGAVSAADAGGYFAWGESRIKGNYSWSAYSHGMGEDRLTKYKSSDGREVLDFSDDAARTIWGKGCRMPTLAEFAELRDSCNCIWQWTARRTSDGTSIYGYQVTSRRNGKSIFLPAAGCRDGGSMDFYGSRGYYWSASLNVIYNFYAHFLCLERDAFFTSYDYRYYGLTIRPVADKYCKEKNTRK